MNNQSNIIDILDWITGSRTINDHQTKNLMISNFKKLFNSLKTQINQKNLLKHRISKFLIILNSVPIE